MKDDRLQGLCAECSHRYHCEDAKRHLDMIRCSRFKQRKHRVKDQENVNAEKSKNMSRYIDADELIDWIKNSQQMTSKVKAIITKIECDASCDDGIKEAIEHTPPAPFLEEIVRCKDCKYNKAKNENKGVCGLMVYVHNASDYCSYGKREDDE